MKGSDETACDSIWDRRVFHERVLIANRVASPFWN